MERLADFVDYVSDALRGFLHVIDQSTLDASRGLLFCIGHNLKAPFLLLTGYT